jgi:hypothetical protein
MNPQDAAATSPRTLSSPRHFLFVSRWVAILGLVVLGYLVGAAVMVYELPTSDFLAKALIGARAWGERLPISSLQASAQDPPPVAEGTIDEPAKTFDGFTLYACVSLHAPSTRVYLMNMRRQVVHRWAISFSEVWPAPPHLKGRVRDELVGIYACYLYPNGDLLVVFHGMEQLANGYGLVKLDKDSKVIWKYAAHVHHDVDVGEDGTVYTVQHDLIEKMPKGLEHVPTPCLVDSLVLLSPEGQLKKTIPILEAFQDSPYSPLLGSLGQVGNTRASPGGLTATGFVEALRREDMLHANSVQVLRRKLAPRFHRFKAGQVLMSFRNLDAIAVLDVEKGSVVWAARGPWQAQHDAQFLDNGHVLLFDNLGSSRGSRVLEYDPHSQAFPWSYAGEQGHPFYTGQRGMSQRLPNGNTLVVNSEGGELLEVTPGKEVVWSFLSPAEGESPDKRRFITTARRYSPDQLPFLEGREHARP